MIASGAVGRAVVSSLTETILFGRWGWLTHQAHRKLFAKTVSYGPRTPMVVMVVNDHEPCIWWSGSTL